MSVSSPLPTGGTWQPGSKKTYAEGKGTGQGGTGTQKRGGVTPRAQDSPEFLLSALPGKV